MNDLRVNTDARKMPSYFRRPSYDNLKNFYDTLDDADGRRQTYSRTRRALYRERRAARGRAARRAVSSAGSLPAGVDRVRSALLGGFARQAPAQGFSHRVVFRRGRARD